jgi:hypothetical protein
VPNQSSERLPEFPCSALPSWLRAFIENVSVSHQVPAALPALSALAVASACVAGKGVVLVRPGYTEPLCLWTACVLGSGERKSAVVRDATRPVEQVEAALSDVWNSVAAEEHAPPVPFRDRFDRLDNIFEQAEPSPELPRFRDVVRALTAQYDEIAPGVEPQLMVDNVTTASFVEILQRQAGRLAILNAEGALFENLTRFARSGGADIDEFLRAHVGEPIRRHRKGQPAIVIRTPQVTIGIAPQPYVIRALRQSPALRGRGLIARFLWAVPESRMGTRDVAPPGLDAAILRSYEGHVHAMLMLGWPGQARSRASRPHELSLTEGALKVRDAFATQIERRLGIDGDLRVIADWANKAAGLTVRIAGVLHLAEHALAGDAAFGRPISEETMSAAVEVGRFAIPHALAVHEMMDGNSLEDDAAYVVAALRKLDWREFTLSQLHKRVDTRFRRSKQVAAVLEHLVARGVLSLVALRTLTGGRPEGPRYTWADT